MNGRHWPGNHPPSCPPFLISRSCSQICCKLLIVACPPCLHPFPVDSTECSSGSNLHSTSLILSLHVNHHFFFFGGTLYLGAYWPHLPGYVILTFLIVFHCKFPSNTPNLATDHFQGHSSVWLYLGTRLNLLTDPGSLFSVAFHRVPAYSPSPFLPVRPQNLETFYLGCPSTSDHNWKGYRRAPYQKNFATVCSWGPEKATKIKEWKNYPVKRRPNINI